MNAFVDALPVSNTLLTHMPLIYKIENMSEYSL